MEVILMADLYKHIILKNVYEFIVLIQGDIVITV